MSKGGRCWIVAFCALALGGMCIGAPRELHAQRIATPRLTSAAPLPPASVVPALPFTSPFLADSARRRAIVPVAPPRSRGAIAVRGLLLGAVVGGVVGYYLHRDEEYGGAVLGPVFGVVVGAPVGMILLLLATPVEQPN